MTPINRLEPCPEGNQLVPDARIEHLLSEEQRQLAMRDGEAFEALGQEMERRRIRETMYPNYYQSIRDEFDAGVSRDDILDNIHLIADPYDAGVYREAYDDVLAGLPPRVGKDENA